MNTPLSPGQTSNVTQISAPSPQSSLSLPVSKTTTKDGTTNLFTGSDYLTFYILVYFISVCYLLYCRFFFFLFHNRAIHWSGVIKAFHVSLWRRAYTRNVRRLCFLWSAIRQPFYISMCIWTLPTQHTVYFKPRLHYNVLGTTRLIYWYWCRFFSARHDKFWQCKRCRLGTRAEIFSRAEHYQIRRSRHPY